MYKILDGDVVLRDHGVKLNLRNMIAERSKTNVLMNI